MFRSTGLLLLAVLMLSFIPLFAQAPTPVTGTPELKLDTLDSQPVVIMDTFKVTRGEFNKVIMSLQPEQREQALTEAARKTIVENMLRRKVFLAEARAEKLPDHPAVKAAINNAVENILLQALTEKHTEGKFDGITRDSLKKIYETSPKQFTRPEQVKLAQLFTASEADAKSLYKRLQAGEAFATLAKLSEGLGKDRDGEIGYFSRDGLPKEIADVVFKQKLNTYTEPIKTDRGYHIMLVEDKQPEALMPFDQIEKDLYDQVVSQVRTAVMDEYYKTQIKAMDQQWKNSVLQK